MKLSIGIVGLPNVGKSTLFNALLKKQVAFAANYPFATIEPNVGVVEVPDERLQVLSKLVNAQKIVPAIVEFYDIAGLVRGASQGEGLGNQFLSHIREVAAIVQVVRIFEDGDIIHVANKVDPKDDIETIKAELILADLSTLHKQREPKGKFTKDDEQRYGVVQKLKTELDKGLAARQVELSDEEIALIQDLHLLTLKPQFYLFNVSEKQLQSKSETEVKIREVLTTVGDGNALALYLCAKLENEIVAFSEDEQKEYLQQYDLTETGLNRLIKTAYATLGLISYLTAGEIEVRAWTIKKGELAPEAAGAIHTDFIKKFIKADIVPYKLFVDAGGWVKSREQGKVTMAGRDYEMQDGDVADFKIGA
ncbi:MAG: redox-regulated ATPase YchF [Candidatus Roizmanbacteria bacterium]